MFSFNFSSDKLDQNEFYFGCANLDFGTPGEVNEDLWQGSFNSCYYPSSFNAIDRNQKEFKTLSIITTKDSIYSDNVSKINQNEIQSQNIQSKETNNCYETKENEDQCSPFLKPLPIASKQDSLLENLMEIINKVEFPQFDGSLSSLIQLEEQCNIKRCNKNKRFGRKEDRDLFDKLKKLCKENRRELKEFWINNTNIDSTLNRILEDVLYQVNFKGSKSLLLKRIRNIASNPELTIREKKLLKVLVTAQIKANLLNLAQIEYFFPGKPSHIIRREVGQVLISDKPNLWSQ